MYLGLLLVSCVYFLVFIPWFYDFHLFFKLLSFPIAMAITYYLMAVSFQVALEEFLKGRKNDPRRS